MDRCHLPAVSEGIYDEIITRALEESLVRIDEREFEIVRETISSPSSAEVLSQYMRNSIKKGLSIIGEKAPSESAERAQLAVCNDMIRRLSAASGDEGLLDMLIDDRMEKLLAVLNRAVRRYTLSDGRLHRPDTPLSISALFTGSGSEPSLASQLRKEIATSDSVDLLVSFIRWSGLRLIIEELRRLSERGRIRVITTCYMGATEAKCVDELMKIGNTELKVNYDTRSTRLHAKAYIFHRSSGMDTVYIGSSNISGPALGSGLEWNMKASSDDLPHIITGVNAAFETYWNDPDFQNYSVQDRAKLVAALKAESSGEGMTYEPMFVIRPFPFQKQVLERLEAERLLHGRTRNLVVAATGTGKTVISAFDYKAFRGKNPDSSCRFLFVAHRKDILDQSLRCYRNVLLDQNFGELYYGDSEVSSFDHLFASIQSINSKEICEALPSDFYDFIVVDEFHHSAAASYRQILSHFKPRILLGLTATPERMDGRDICQEFFDGRMAAEIRLPEAINRQLLVPFQYFGITDSANLSDVRFTRGRYDAGTLESIYTGDDARARLIADAVERYVADLGKVRGLGFCAGIRHAAYMAEAFSRSGIPSEVLEGKSTQQERKAAVRRLKKGDTKFIFTVDLYNEGVDIPFVNTILLLRPTESLTIFLQQLGRGLRLCDGKAELTVLDFIGAANSQYDFESKFRALLSRTRRPLKEEISEGFPSLPRGCSISLEKVAQEHVLENIQGAIVNKRYLVRALGTYKGAGAVPSLEEFISGHPNVRLADIYSKGTYASFCRQAGLHSTPPAEVDGEDKLINGLFRLQQCDSRRFIDFMLEVLENGRRSPFTSEEARMLLMFNYTLWGLPPAKLGYSDAASSLRMLESFPDIMLEAIGILKIIRNRISFVDERLDLGYTCPLDLHCSYTRDQILAALGRYTETSKPDFREGVLHIRELDTDILLVNLLKDEKNFSPTTMYKDYAISPSLFHWQTQSTVSSGSNTASRYISRDGVNGRVLLFARESKTGEFGKPLPYMYLGPARFVDAQGNRPVSIRWHLERPMPAEFTSIAMTASIG